MVISPLVKIQTWLAYMYNPSVYHTRKRGERWGAKSGQRGGGNGVSWLLNGVLVGVVAQSVGLADGAGVLEPARSLL